VVGADAAESLRPAAHVLLGRDDEDVVPALVERARQACSPSDWIASSLVSKILCGSHLHVGDLDVRGQRSIASASPVRGRGA